MSMYQSINPLIWIYNDLHILIARIPIIGWMTMDHRPLFEFLTVAHMSTHIFYTWWLITLAK